MKTEIIGPDAGRQLEARVLNMVIPWEETGITWEPDPRHVEIRIEQMGLKDSSHRKFQESRRRRRVTGNFAGTSA